ncbi:hypothetical protein HDU76_005371 [Blyttiomyces sp. JEL0837]|nr:hypothetical protein HDU76_005371 [Blyttiomyces sp. JEL0837]
MLTARTPKFGSKPNILLPFKAADLVAEIRTNFNGNGPLSRWPIRKSGSWAEEENLTFVAHLLEFESSWLEDQFRTVAKGKRAGWFWERVSWRVRSIRNEGAIDLVFCINSNMDSTPETLEVPSNIPHYDGGLYEDGEYEARMTNLARVINEHKQQNNRFKFPFAFTGNPLIILARPVDGLTSPQKRGKGGNTKSPASKKAKTSETPQPAMEVIELPESPPSQVQQRDMTFNGQLMSGKSPLVPIKMEPRFAVASVPETIMEDVEVSIPSGDQDHDLDLDLNRSNDLESNEIDAKSKSLHPESISKRAAERGDPEKKVLKVLLKFFLGEKLREKADVNVRIDTMDNVHITDVFKAARLAVGAVVPECILVAVVRLDNDRIQFGEEFTAASSNLEYKCILKQSRNNNNTTIVPRNSQSKQNNNNGDTIADLIQRAKAYNDVGDKLREQAERQNGDAKVSADKIVSTMIENTPNARKWPTSADMYKYYSAIVALNDKLKASLGNEFKKALKRVKFSNDTTAQLPTTFKEYFKFVNKYVLNNQNKFLGQGWEVNKAVPKLVYDSEGNAGVESDAESEGSE